MSLVHVAMSCLAMSMSMLAVVTHMGCKRAAEFSCSILIIISNDFNYSNIASYKRQYFSLQY